MKMIQLVVTGTVSSDKPTNEEIASEVAGKCAGARSAAAVLVSELQKAGVNIKTATQTFGSPAGSHEPPIVVDLTAVAPEPVVVPEPEEPTPAPTV